MLYFKKSELAETYHISEKTVTNWIKEAKDGKIPLELHEVGGRAWIANTTKNIELIEQLVEARRKFRNSRGIKIITPKPEFYNLYTQQQIFDIASNLDIHHEIPFQYGYFDGGAEYWDKYAERLASEGVSNFLNTTVEQLHINQSYIDHLLKPYQRVNVIDIGPGNAMPLKDSLSHLVDEGKLERYVAVDISPTMLRIAERNIKEWFGTRVSFGSRAADINYDRFTDLLVEDTLDKNAQNTANLIFALGGTFANLRFPDGALKVVHDSMNRNDVFVYNLKLDSEAARQYFDFGIGHNMPALDAKSEMILSLLGIDKSFYDVEMGYDAGRKERYIRIRLKLELTVKFTFENGERSVKFNKNDTILLWRFWHQGVQDVIRQLHKNDFDVLQTSLTEDKDYLLTVSRVKSER